MTTDNTLHPEFNRLIQLVRDRYFSRNPKFWPCFQDPTFQSIIEHRLRDLHPEDRFTQYPDAAALFAAIKSETTVPGEMTEPSPAGDPLLMFAASLSKNWENPASVENVVTTPSDPAIFGAMCGLLANPNLVYRDYSEMADDLEKHVIRQMASLAGYDPEDATGIFTQGGTFCNLYGYLTGIRKSLPEAREYGMGYIHDYRIFNSQGGHYSNITNLSLLGVDIRQKTIRIQIDDNNEMDMADLEQKLTACFTMKCVVPTIMLTMGTTDTFGVDQVYPVYALVNRLCDQFEISVKPHIHVDAAVGWPILFFCHYDFDQNPLSINTATLKGLKRNVVRFNQLKYADSFTIDFQKWGYVPYTSSLVMFKTKADLKALENDPDNFSYFERDIQGISHLQSTIECSRGGVGMFGAYSALKYMGMEGYQIAIANSLQNANYFRAELNKLGYVKVMAETNQGPSVGFRIYNPDRISSAEAEFAGEFQHASDAQYHDRILENNRWHRDFFLHRKKLGLLTNWVEFIAHTAYDEKGHYHRLPGEKAVFMNPNTTRETIDIYIQTLKDWVSSHRFQTSNHKHQHTLSGVQVQEK